MSPQCHDPSMSAPPGSKPPWWAGPLFLVVLGLVVFGILWVYTILNRATGPINVDNESFRTTVPRSGRVCDTIAEARRYPLIPVMRARPGHHGLTEPWSVAPACTILSAVQQRE